METTKRQGATIEFVTGTRFKILTCFRCRKTVTKATTDPQVDYFDLSNIEGSFRFPCPDEECPGMCVEKEKFSLMRDDYEPVKPWWRFW